MRVSTVGIKYDIHQNKLGNDVFQEGLHAGPPGYEFIKFPKVFKTIAFNGLKCLNQDGLTIKLSVQFQYKVNEKEIKALIQQFRDHERYVRVLKYEFPFPSISFLYEKETTQIQ